MWFLSKHPNLAVIRRSRHAVAVVVQQHALLPGLLAQPQTQGAHVLDGGIERLAVFEAAGGGTTTSSFTTTTRRTRRRPRQLPLGVLLLQTFRNQFLGAAAGRDGAGIHPALQHGAGVRFDQIGRVGAHIQGNHQADRDGFHAVAEAPVGGDGGWDDGSNSDKRSTRDVIRMQRRRRGSRAGSSSRRRQQVVLRRVSTRTQQGILCWFDNGNGPFAFAAAAQQQVGKGTHASAQDASGGGVGFVVGMPPRQRQWDFWLQPEAKPSPAGADRGWCGGVPVERRAVAKRTMRRPQPQLRDGKHLGSGDDSSGCCCGSTSRYGARVRGRYTTRIPVEQ